MSKRVWIEIGLLIGLIALLVGFAVYAVNINTTYLSKDFVSDDESPLKISLEDKEIKQVAEAKAENSKESLEALVDRLAKPYGLAKSIKAIILKESAGGIYKVNINDKPFGSCGVTHINLKTYLARHNIKATSFNINKACMDLINNDELAIANAIEELLYWQEQFCNNKQCTKKQWTYIYSAYNAGWNYKSKQGLKYAEAIKEYVRLNNFVSLNNI